MNPTQPASQRHSENAARHPVSVLHPFITNLGILVGVILILAILRPATAAGQGALNNGGNHSDAISAAGQQDTWTFAVTAGDHVFLRASQTSGGTAFAPRIRVFDAAQNLVGRAAGADSSSASSARLDYIATATGTFTLVVDSNLAGGTGNYRVDFLRQPGADDVALRRNRWAARQ